MGLRQIYFIPIKMIVELEALGRKWQVDLDKAHDCSSTFGDSAREPRAWHAPPVKVEPVKMGDWVGSIEAGASVNFYRLELNPHGNGTHTECYGHIDGGHQKLNDHLQKHHFIAYFHRQAASQQGQDLVLLKQDLPEIDWQAIDAFAIEAQGVQFPQDFTGTNPVYFEPELCAFLAQKGVKHLICNLPSVDREEDGGALAAHKAFWHYPAAIRKEATITELAVFPKEMLEGHYWLHLQTSPIHNDAVPSRPFFYPLK